MTEQDTAFNRIKKFTEDISPAPLTRGRVQKEIKEVAGKKVHLEDFEIMESRTYKSAFAVLHLKEHPENYFYAGSVIAKLLTDYDDAGLREDFKIAGGIPVIFTERIPQDETKSNYFVAEFFPEE